MRGASNLEAIQTGEEPERTDIAASGHFLLPMTGNAAGPGLVVKKVRPALEGVGPGLVGKKVRPALEGAGLCDSPVGDGWGGDVTGLCELEMLLSARRW
jgi:hypothetical protein